MFHHGPMIACEYYRYLQRYGTMAKVGAPRTVSEIARGLLQRWPSHEAAQLAQGSWYLNPKAEIQSKRPILLSIKYYMVCQTVESLRDSTTHPSCYLERFSFSTIFHSLMWAHAWETTRGVLR